MFCREPDKSAKTVLIVDASQDARDVLRTVLQRPGTVVLEAREPHEGLELARRHRPRVIVLDLDAGTMDDQSVQDTFELHREAHDGALVVLGKVRRYTERPTDTCVLSKPYHYRELVRTIEQFLADNENLAAAADPA